MRSSFWTRARHEYAFKLNDTNELADYVDVPVIQQQMILDTPLPYKDGQQLNGYFKFKTGNYLRAFDVYCMEQSDDPHKKMDTLYTSGTIHFTCKVNMRADEYRHKH